MYYEYLNTYLQELLTQQIIAATPDEDASLAHQLLTHYSLEEYYTLLD